ncbi:hypothetical protein P7C70_g2794, partial [Phenoliferia sp. Uapishka_3]
AKGFFQVFVDPSLSSRPSSSTSHSSSSTLRSSSHRKGLLATPSTTSIKDCWNGKENFDPFAKTEIVKGGKPKLAGGKAVIVKLDQQEEEKSFLAPPSRAIPPRPTLTSSEASTNGICTGTLRTRVLPFDLSKPTSSRSTSSSSTSAPLSMLEILDASPADLLKLKGPTSKNSTIWDLMDSPSSARDSGYARSEGDEREGEDGEDATVRVSFEAERKSIELERTREELNRRARKLTESPLAEVTEAFTGLGSFTLPPLSPSPTRRPTPLPRTRSSPTHTASSQSSKQSKQTPEIRVLKGGKPYAIPGNFVVPSDGPVPVKKVVRKKKSFGEGLSKGVRALRM